MVANCAFWSFARSRDQHARVHDPRRVKRALRRNERFAEQVGALRAIPGHMVAPDRVMMSDRAAGGDQSIGGAGLDVAPLLDEPPWIAAHVEGVVDGRPVRIHMSEAG